MSCPRLTIACSLLALWVLSSPAAAQWKDLTQPKPEAKPLAPVVTPKWTALTHQRTDSLAEVRFLRGDGLLALTRSPSSAAEKIYSTHPPMNQAAGTGGAVAGAAADHFESGCASVQPGQVTGVFAGRIRGESPIFLVNAAHGQLYTALPGEIRGTAEKSYLGVWFDPTGQRMTGVHKSYPFGVLTEWNVASKSLSAMRQIARPEDLSRYEPSGYVFSPDGRRLYCLYTVDTWGEKDDKHSVVVIDTSSGTALSQMDIPVEKGEFWKWIDCSADGNRLAVGPAVFDTKTGSRIASYTLGRIPTRTDYIAARFTPDGNSLVFFSVSGGLAATMCCPDGSCRTFEANDGFRDTKLRCFDVALGRDGRCLAVVDGRVVRLWEIASHKLLATLTGNAEAVFSVAISFDGRSIASIGEDGATRLWDVSGVLPERR